MLEDVTRDGRDHPVAETPPPLPGSVFPAPPVPSDAGPHSVSDARRRSERVARKRALGRTRGHAAGLRVAAGAREAAKVFRPLTLSRRQALAAAGAAAAVGSLSALALGGRSELAGASNALGAKASGPTAAGVGSPTVRLGTSATPARLVPVPVARNLSAEHLMRRVTYGPTPAMRAQVSALGLSNWLALQLAPARIADPLGNKVNALYPRLSYSMARAHAMQKQGDDYYKFLYEVGLLHLGRAVWSERQLNEVMVDFWSNHLNVPAPADKGSFARHRYDADVIRKHAFGRFEDMLLASSTHPAMLAYLDNALSTKQQPNENYAREIMELHTLGVDGGYTERDIKQAALLLTGWEITDQATTRYVPARHHSRPVTILGTRYANGTGQAGRLAQQRFVRNLASHPSTARYICRKLAIHFISDAPSAELVNALTRTYLRNKTAISPVLRQLFGSAEFAAAEGAKMRRPLERTIAVIRTLGPKFTGNKDALQQVYWMTGNSGQTPMAWPTPDGYPDLARKWQSPADALELINQTTGLVYGWSPDKLGLPGSAKLLAKPPANRSAMIDVAAKRVLGRLPTAQERTAVAQLLAGTKLPTRFASDGWARESTAALTAIAMMSSPAFLTR